MALSVLDGNQTATTLSSVVTGGEHIVAHSVVSLGANAIANITSAVSGSVVSVSNFPATQPISGSVSISGTHSVTFSAVTISNFPASQTVAGTVTANVLGYSDNETSYQPIPVVPWDESVSGGRAVVVKVEQTGVGAIPVSGTVTANVGLNSVGPAVEADSSFSLSSRGMMVVGGISTSDVGSPDEYKELKITSTGEALVRGTVTVGAVPNGSLTTRFGTPTTANTAFATSAVTNASRKYLLIQNVTTGSNVITVGIGFTPTTTQGIQLTAGAGITFESSYIPTGAVYVLSSVTASNFTVLEA